MENRKNLSLRKLRFFFKIIKLNKKNNAQKVIIMSGIAGPVIKKNGTSINI
tara:strand:+ start:99 stop:251 length:153 start_codon:yes stop_codon:yes gene_type:complete